MADKVLVVGDVCLDVVSFIGGYESIEPLGSGVDVTCRTTVRATLGGSAWLFAEAVLLSDVEVAPIIVAGVGDDIIGRVLRLSLSESGAATDGIELVQQAATQVVSLSYLDKLQRLMSYPVDHANLNVGSDHVAKLLGSLCPEDVTLCWVSGYSAVSPETGRFQATRLICDWCRARSIPIAIDLVPHDFWDAAGGLGELDRRIGPVNVVVGELKTLSALGETRDIGVFLHSSRGGTLAASLGCDPGQMIVIQHRASADEYVQAVVVANRLVERMRYPVSGGLRGLGDRMAVDALRSCGVLGLRRTALPDG
jgi:sugar/nucleoside kinase (ribokinase family)